MVRRMREVFPVFPERKEFEWVATGGAQGEVPNYTSVLFPYAGYAVMRTGWDENATYVAFDGGMPGYGHIHFDKLNLILWSHGRELLYDGGGGQYES
ncbi:MAG: heparinase II/III family protein, partial [Candidatus Latescibacteria bacterium]|nr:heparinase II/III family protein [Candidatus Latescibacterota bacterium]